MEEKLKYPKVKEGDIIVVKHSFKDGKTCLCCRKKAKQHLRFYPIKAYSVGMGSWHCEFCWGNCNRVKCKKTEKLPYFAELEELKRKRENHKKHIKPVKSCSLCWKAVKPIPSTLGILGVIL